MTEDLKQLLISLGNDYDQLMKYREQKDEEAGLGLLDSVRKKIHEFFDEYFAKRNKI